ncbi:reverse transcriptase domain-containing protein [Tanacetum coccineum]
MLEDQSTTREKARRERSKSRRKRSGHQETSSDSEYEEGLDDACEDLNSPYKRPKPTPFTQRITHFKYHKRAKLPRNVRVYEGNKDPKDHLGIFSVEAEQEEWLMPIWCKMFRQTLGGAARNWFDDLDPKSVDSFEELIKEANRGSRGLGEIGSSSEGHPPKQPAEWEPMKEWCEVIPRSQLTDEPIILEGIIEGNQVRRILVDRGSSSEIMYEHYFRNLGVNIRSRLRRCKISMIDFSGETYHPLGVIDLRVTLGKDGRNKTVLMEFAIIKCRSPYNSIIGRTEMRSLGAVGSTIHSMIKFPTNQGVVTMETSREALQECKHLERVQGSWKEVQWRQREEQMSRIREQVILRTKSNSVIGPTSDPMSLERAWGRDNEEEAFTFSHELLDQYVTMGTTLTTNYTQLLVDVLRENREVFAWTGAERTTVPRFIMEHQLRIYPFAKPMVHKRRPMASEGRLEFKEKVFHWLKE